MNRFEWERRAMAQTFKGEALRVLWCYASHAAAETLITFPSTRDVSKETGISVEKVGRYRRELLATGWLVASNEKTSRGNPKLQLAEGQDIEEGYLGIKRKMNKNSMRNLVPAAYQKFKALDSPDKAGLETPETTGLEDAGIESLEYPDVTISKLNNQSRTIKNNQREESDAAGASSDLEEDYIREEFQHICSIDSFLNYELGKGVGFLNFEDVEGLEGFKYQLSLSGVPRKPVEPSEPKRRPTPQEAAQEFADTLWPTTTRATAMAGR